MKYWRYATLSIMLTGLTGCYHTPRFQTGAVPGWTPHPEIVQSLNEEDGRSNGIEVGQPKVYDDASLRMMLNATRANLAGMSGLDQGSLISALTNVSGATITQNQFGVQVGPGALPTVATTNASGTNSTTTNSQLPENNTTIAGTTSTVTQPTTQTVTTMNPNQPIPTAPSGLAFTPPATVAPSSLDLLNEQMQLSYEMASLQLLLEGALSDRFVASQRFVKPKVTLGFPITLRPPAAARDAVAVVEVTVKTVKNVLSDEAPAVTALLPREKTYNVAAMTDNTASIGAGAVIGAVAAGGTFIRGRKTLYLVQDQDTVALQGPELPNAHQTTFMWEFRPVLGEHFVRGGLKQTFVQLAMPVLSTLPCFGTVEVHTYWRKFDRRNGVTQGAIGNSLLVSNTTFPIANFDLTPRVGDIAYKDLGDGTVLVSVLGDFLEGTYVELGSTRYEAGKNLVVEDSGVKFVAPMAAVARWTGRIVARTGDASDLLVPLTSKPLEAIDLSSCGGSAPVKVPDPSPGETAHVSKKRTHVECKKLAIEGEVVPVPLDQTNSLLPVKVVMPAAGDAELSQLRDSLMIEVGGKVFGLRDAPIRREKTDHTLMLTAVAPTALLVSNPEVRVFRPFWTHTPGNEDTCYDARKPIADVGLDSATERLVLVSVDKDGNATYILYGNGLEDATLLVPKPSITTKLDAVDHIGKQRMLLVTISKNDLSTTKKLVLQKKDTQRPLVLDIPDAKPTAPKVTVDSPVIQNTDRLLISAENRDQIATVKMGDKALKWDKPTEDKSVIRLLNLKADGVTDEQKSREITVEYNDGTKVTVKLEVVVARIGVK